MRAPRGMQPDADGAGAARAGDGGGGDADPQHQHHAFLHSRSSQVGTVERVKALTRPLFPLQAPCAARPVWGSLAEVALVGAVGAAGRRACGGRSGGLWGRGGGQGEGGGGGEAQGPSECAGLGFGPQRPRIFNRC